MSKFRVGDIITSAKYPHILRIDEVNKSHYHISYWYRTEHEIIGWTKLRNGLARNCGPLTEVPFDQLDPWYELMTPLMAIIRHDCPNVAELVRNGNCHEEDQKQQVSPGRAGQLLPTISLQSSRRRRHDK